jgi:aryl-phospho-beta-D-glucosidase BglC (GH1 family)
MGSLSTIYIKKETLKTLLDVVTKKDEKGIEITISTNDESNQFGQNLSSYVSQTKEQREAKKDKFYVGNGKVFWTDGKVVIGVKKEEIHQATPINEDEPDDLPF